MERVGPVAYKLKLPHKLNKVHDTFHMCNLKKYLSNENLVISLDEIHFNTKIHFMEELLEITDREIQRLKKTHTYSKSPMEMS